MTGVITSSPASGASKHLDSLKRCVPVLIPDGCVGFRVADMGPVAVARIFAHPLPLQPVTPLINLRFHTPFFDVKMRKAVDVLVWF
jgi:hypothetical protein